ncbi:HD family phosphohydrolase [Olsenella sp. YH-ols2217]|uniref:HD family phosphohydrolase n=1 Tax=Kribbibacterium absianum TaxID=3044210 RepID=A0ABT6ZKU9_9ACTN|nr:MULTISPECIES: HD family phosphohydrolase [unclassified Olsenella]MDJ1121673.1 HD family phosphohydrolase [Olsenella sp. YH-ols2216]MDJ1129681.1 HD family phosphohydrolase [Olsenella sp. YH-ols2217]
MATLQSGITDEQAHDLLTTYNKDPFHVSHGETVGGLMRYFAAEYDPENEDFWYQVGLLHDLDWEMFDPELHTLKTAELLAEAGASPELAKSIQTHQSDLNPDLPAPELKMEKMLYASDELSGLITACVAMRPSKSVMDFNVKSLKKKFKTKSFAAGCNRDDIRRGAELNGLELDELFAMVIEGMKSFAPDKDTFGAE